jgi:phage shock protein PspC (stress-responsive transcriptional regulator)
MDPVTVLAVLGGVVGGSVLGLLAYIALEVLNNRHHKGS